MKKVFYGLLVGAMVLTGCGKKEVEEVKVVEPKKIVSATVNKRVVTDIYEGDAVATPKTKIDHLSDSEGTVIKLYKQNGDKVQKGELIVTLRDSKVESDYLSAKAAFESAKSSFDITSNNFKKYQNLYERQLVSESEYLDYKNRKTDAEGNYLAKKANLVDAQDKFKKLNRTSETNGIVGNLFLKEGNEVKTKDRLFTIIDETEMEISLDFPGKWFSKIKLGAETTVKVSDLSDKEFKGYIKEINPVADSETKKYKVKLGVPNIDVTNSGNVMKDGMYIKATIPAGEREVLTVPQQGVFVRSLQSYVFLISNGEAKRVEVIPGTIAAPFVEITSEKIKTGDKIVVDGIFGLVDGDKVQEIQ
ncbi:MAG: efflux RND transporter periplasmic adaptor subunit [Fusobacteriaceae bacterium]